MDSLNRTATSSAVHDVSPLLAQTYLSVLRDGFMTPSVSSIQSTFIMLLICMRYKGWHFPLYFVSCNHSQLHLWGIQQEIVDLSTNERRMMYRCAPFCLTLTLCRVPG